MTQLKNVAMTVYWVRLYVCVATSTGVDPQGTANYYVDWTTRGCVKDCDGPAPCGGLSKGWDQVYASSTECCKNLWKDPTDCFIVG